MVRTPEGPSGQVVLCLPGGWPERWVPHWFPLWQESAASNMQSALAHPKVVSSFLAAEVGKGRVLGPARTDVCKSIHINRFGLVPKGTSGEQW